MPMSIDFRSNIAKVMKDLDDVQVRQIPFAASKAINDTAFDVMRHLRDKTKVYMESPVPFTQKSILVQRSNKRNLIAFVYVREDAEPYMHPLVFGGLEVPKKVALVQPIKTTRQFVNKYGNLKPGVVRSLKSVTMNYRTRRTARGKRRRGPTVTRTTNKYFFGVPRGRSGTRYEGVWVKTAGNKKINQVIHFQREPRVVPKSFPYHELGIKRASRVFGAKFLGQLDRALGSAR